MRFEHYVFNYSMFSFQALISLVQTFECREKYARQKDTKDRSHAKECEQPLGAENGPWPTDFSPEMETLGPIIARN